MAPSTLPALAGGAAPSGATVPLTSFNELLCHLAAAHERELAELRAEVNYLRENSPSSTSQRPTLVIVGEEDYDALPQDSGRMLMEVTTRSEIDGLERPPCSPNRANEALPSGIAPSITQIGPDAKALASALQVAGEERCLGLADPSKESASFIRNSGDDISGNAFSTNVDSSGAARPPEVPELEAPPPPLSLQAHVLPAPGTALDWKSTALLQVSTPSPTNLPGPPPEDHEPVAEEDKHGAERSMSIDSRLDFVDSPSLQAVCSRRVDSPNIVGFDNSSHASMQMPPATKVVWNVGMEKTGDASSTVKAASTPDLNVGRGLSNAIWLETSIHVSGRPSASKLDGIERADERAEPAPEPRRESSECTDPKSTLGL